MPARLPRLNLTLLHLVLLCAAGSAWSAGKAHQHGVLKLDVAVEGSQLNIAMEAPLDNLLGFERAPRNDAERKAAADVLARLRAADQAVLLFAVDAAAQCSVSKIEVNAPVLEPGAQAANKDEHADLDASYAFNCAQPAQLRNLDIGLFDAFKRVQQIDVQVAAAKGQSKATLKRPARRVKLQP